MVLMPSFFFPLLMIPILLRRCYFGSLSLDNLNKLLRLALFQKKFPIVIWFPSAYTEIGGGGWFPSLRSVSLREVITCLIEWLLLE
jgi:hypothetical protein